MRDTEGLTALHRAARLGNMDWATALLGAGALVDASGALGASHRAFGGDRAELVSNSCRRTQDAGTALRVPQTRASARRCIRRCMWLRWPAMSSWHACC